MDTMVDARAQMRRSFLCELIKLSQSNTSINIDYSHTQSTSTQKQLQEKEKEKEKIGKHLINTNNSDNSISNIKITLLSDSDVAGRTLTGLAVGCDTKLTHMLVDNLETPIGIQKNCLLRLNDVIAITY